MLEKKILNYCSNRGLKEVSLILHSFANQYLYNMNNRQIEDFLEVITQPDLDLLSWIYGDSELPKELTGNSILIQIIDIYNGK